MRNAVMLLATGVVWAAGPADDRVRDIAGRLAAPGVLWTALGVTRGGTAIPALVTADDFDYASKKTRVLVVAGLDGGEGSSRAVEEALRWFYNDPAAAKLRARYAVSAVPLANPESKPMSPFPPQGEAYNNAANAEQMYLWRWVGAHAPDFVVVVGEGPGADSGCARLACQLGKSAAAGVGTIPAVEVEAKKGFLAEALARAPKTASPARAEMQKRVARSPLDISKQLAERYGKELPEAVYIPAMALIGRMKLGELTKDSSQLAMVEKIVAPYFDGSKKGLEKPTSSHLSGHLVFGELYARTKKPRYLELARAAADMGFDGGTMKESMPLHSEMSDSVFMGTPILVQVGRLTGETRYYDMAMRHLRFMLKLNLRGDGLHRHSPLDETAWGRGNGFPALGLALSLSELPENHSGREEMLKAFRSHMEAMLMHQSPSGMWHQVVDHPESYRELTVTCMTAFAMERGMKRGWLDAAYYRKAVDRAWYAIKSRVAADGGLIDVCTNTGKQKSLRDYYDRPAVLGPDARGGAMVWLIANELAAR